MTIIELCVDDVDGVRAARIYGVDRVELCAALDVGGLTPPLGLVRDAINEAPAGGLQVIVRSRPGDFVYTPHEVAVMCDTLRELRAATHDAPVTVGFVVGAVTSDGRIDEAAAAAFRRAAGERPLTFHRAFDVIGNQSAGLDILIALGYQRVLTTGGDEAVAQTRAMRALVEHAQGRIGIIASGGVRAHNVAQILHQSGAPEVHMRAPGQCGGTDPEQVRAIVTALRGRP